MLLRNRTLVFLLAIGGIYAADQIAVLQPGTVGACTLTRMASKRVLPQLARPMSQIGKVSLTESLVVAEITVSPADGAVSKASILVAPNPEAERAVLSAVEQWRFYPAVKMEQQVPLKGKLFFYFVPGKVILACNPSTSDK